MSSLSKTEEIDLDNLIEYELSCINDNDDDDLIDRPSINHNIAENDSCDVILDKISKAHEDFYEQCFYNTISNGSDEDEDDGDNLGDSLDSRTARILKSYHIKYEDFILTLPKINDELEKSDSTTSMISSEIKKEEDVNNPTQAWIVHENVLRQINTEKWNQYDSFFNNLNDRCQSARSVANKNLEHQVEEEKKRREISQTKMESELQLLDERWKLEEAENKLKMMEIQAEIDEEKKVMIKLQKDVKEVIEVKYHCAAIMIQKVFRRFRIRKRIGAQIDDARAKVRNALFNKKLIILEKETQKKRAIELRKWKKDRDKQLFDKKTRIKDEKLYSPLENKEEIFLEEQESICNDLAKQENNNNVLEFREGIEGVLDSHIKFINLENENNEIIDNLEEEQLKEECKEKDEILIKEEIKERNSNLTEIYSSCIGIGEDNIEKNNDNNKETKLEINVEETFEGVSSIISILESNKEINERNMEYLENKMSNLNVSDIKKNFTFEDERKSEGIVNETFETVSSIVSMLESDIEINERNFEDLKNETTNLNVSDIRKDLTFEDERKGEENVEDIYGNVSSIISILESDKEIHERSMQDLENKSSMLQVSDIKKDLIFEVEQEQYLDSKDLKEESMHNVAYMSDNIDVNNENQVQNNIIINHSEGIKEMEEENINGKLKISDSEMENYDENYKNVSDDNKYSTDFAMELIEKVKNVDEIDNEEENPDKVDNNELHCQQLVIVKELNLGNISANDLKEESSITKMEENILKREQINQFSEQRLQEEHLNKIFMENSPLVRLCSEWINYRSTEKKFEDCKVDPFNVLEPVPSFPKHLIQDFDFQNLVMNQKDGNILLESDNTTIELSKSLTIKDVKSISLKNMNQTCPIVQYLTINDTSLTYLHSDDMMESLIYLNLDKNKLEWLYFGSNIGKALTSISCKSNDLSELPPGTFRNCESLVYLDLSENNFLNIGNIFSDYNNLINLCCLNISGNVLSNIENLQKYCPRLTHLSLSNNHIKHWKKEEEFSSLIYCDLSHNSLSRIDKLLNSPLLIKLDLSYNSIDYLEEFVQSWLPCLTELSLDSNKLTELPELYFPMLQKISIKKNYIKDFINIDDIFQNCPLISSLDLRHNIAESVSYSGKFQSILRTDQNENIKSHICCPDGEFSMICYDFIDGINRKSVIMENNLRSSSSIELYHKHQFHFYRFIRDTIEDFSDWLIEFLCPKNSIPSIIPQPASQREIDAAVKIQAFWKGNRMRKWFKDVLKDIKLETEKSFETYVSDFDENYFLGEWDSHCKISSPKEAWIKSNRSLIGDNITQRENISQPDNKRDDNASLTLYENSSRSSSSWCNQQVILGKKDMEAMKEWGFEDPNSLKWMLQRAKHFRGKSEKNNKKSKVASETNFHASNAKRPLKAVPSPVIAMSTVTLPPPNTAHTSSSESKIYEWLLESVHTPLSASRQKLFLPFIDNEAQSNNNNNNTNKVSTRRNSSSTKLPPINTVPINKK